eukprot:m.534889 g.534889  ORF g.534889 m.534889 type:complete len:254 (-) comp22059_c0_seq21:3367-4128(-)
MKKNRKNKFSVRLTISKLLNVPYSHGYFFTKVKLKKGDVTVAKTQRTTVADNTVVWNETVEFDCKIYTDTSGLLIPCFLRISVRKEEKGGKTVEKLGVVNIDLAQYAVGGTVERRYLLQADTKNQGKDNSVLQITLSMTQTKGDHVYRTGGGVSALIAGGTAGEDDGADETGGVFNGSELAELDASLLSIQGAASNSNTLSHTLPIADQSLWTSTRVSADDVVDGVLASLGEPVVVRQNSDLNFDDGSNLTLG